MNAKNRESNIELLRIIAMLFIIIFHYVYNSDFQYTELTTNVLLIKSGWFLGELGVNIFILITGYYLCKSKFSFKKIVLLIFEVLFYNLINVFVGLKIGAISSFSDISYIFPIMTETYWFLTAYLLIYILSPYFNSLINSFNKREYQKFLIIVLSFWCIIPTIFGFFYNTSEILLFYNRLIWLSIMYFIGGYIRLYGIKFLDNSKKSLVTFVITYLIMILSIVIIYIFKDFFVSVGTNKIEYFWTPNNILMLIFSISFFMLFTNLKVNNNKFINKIATSTLGIYLLHDGIIKKYIWKYWFKNNINIYSNYWYVYILISALLIFMVGFVIDLVRQFLERYTIKKIVDLNIWKKVYDDIKIEGKKLIDKIM